MQLVLPDASWLTQGEYGAWLAFPEASWSIRRVMMCDRYFRLPHGRHGEPLGIGAGAGARGRGLEDLELNVDLGLEEQELELELELEGLDL